MKILKSFCNFCMGASLPTDSKSFSHLRDLFTKYVGTLGSIPEKDFILLESEFTLIIENSSEILTEKLYDAILAGTIPVYFGPALEEYGLPNDIAIEIGRNEKEIIYKITQISDEVSRGYLEGITSYLNDESQYKKWVAVMFIKIRLKHL